MQKNGNCFQKVEQLENRINELDKDSPGHAERSKLSIELRRAYEDREDFLKQKSRIQWEEHGDANTRFFHMSVKHRAKQNHIHGIMKEDRWITDPQSLRDVIYNHFKSFYNPQSKENIFLLGSLVHTKISENQVKFLSREFELPEIHSALMSMNSNKSPGPDGVNLEYIKALWNVAHKDIMHMFKEFYRGKKITKGS